MNISYRDVPQMVALNLGKAVPLQIFHVWCLVRMPVGEDCEWVFHEACSNGKLALQTILYAQRCLNLNDVDWRVAVCEELRYRRVFTILDMQKMALYGIPEKSLTPQSEDEKRLSATLY